MPIQFECPHCNASYTVADKLAGKKAKCKKCSGSMVIPDKGAKQTPRAKMTQGSRPEAKPSPKKPGDSKPKSKPETVQAKPRIHDPTAPGQGAMAPVAGIPVSPDGTPELQIPGTEEPLQPISDFSPHSAKPSSAAKSASQAGPAQIQPVTPVQPLPDLAAAASTPIVAQPVPAKQAVSARKSSAAPQAVAASAEPEISQEALLRAIKQEIEPVPTTFAYRLAALFVAALMITLPFIYIGLIGLTGYGLFYFAIYGTEIFQADAGSRGSIILLFVYLAPLFAGAVTILFMIKPLFAGSAKPDPKRSLYREDEPKLFAFVDRLCETVHAPKPKRIDVDCDVNASASFRRGVFSMFGNDLVLTIGMPLVAGLTTRQLAGVLAHEFGHFSQGFGMRVSYLVRMISYWFARVVYERDSWDEWLAEAANSIDIRIGFVLHLARLVVWIVRRVLWVLMMLGQLFSCFLLRQMEFDADLHEIRFSGSDNFRKTCIQLRRLGVGYQESLADQQHFFMNGKLGDDMPLLTKLARDNQDEDFIK
ncbi:MAG: M48 family metalloprotease, partial [Planctomycetota bacterium]